MSKTNGFIAGALLASFVVLSPLAAHADEYTYDLVLQLKLENGQQTEMRGPPYTGFFECLRAKKQTQIGRKFARGLIVSADGNSPSGTIVGVKCVQRIPKMGQ